jgi:hypothetical protein
MENYTDFNDIQQSYLSLAQTSHFPHIDFPSPLASNTLQDLNSFPTDTHQTNFNSTCEIAPDLKTAGESLMLM